jgi:hypothetical protein
MQTTIKLIIALLCLSFSIYADPAITGVGGSTTLTITGSGFGTKSTAAPISWTGTEIDAGTSGNDAVLTGFSQVDVTEVNTVFSNAQSHTGNSILFDLTHSNGSSQYMLDMGTGQTVVFITMWVRLEYTDTCEKFQWKSWRIRSDTDYLHSNGTTVLNDWWYNEATRSWFNSGNLQAYYNNGTLGGNLDATTDQMLFNQWQRIEAYYVASTPSTGNGITWLRRVGRSGNMLSSTSLVTRDSDDPLWRYIRFGQAYSNPTTCGEETGGLKVYLDDIYVDNTLARVEIGDNAVFENTTHREVQIPTAWADGEITVTLNQGIFVDGDSAYLFVIDENGVASDGYLVTVGTSANVTGTALASISESDVVTGSKTLIYTLTGTTWDETIGEDNAITTAFLATIIGNLDWADVPITYANVVRTSDTVLTITLPAAPDYDIASTETVSLGAIPASATELGETITPSPASFTVSYVTNTATSLIMSINANGPAIVPTAGGVAIVPQ